MLIEAATGVFLAVRPPGRHLRDELLVAAVLLALIWLSTALLQMPRHRRLEGGYDEKTHHTLVLTNWIRTAGWSARSIILLVIAGTLMQKGAEAL